MKKIFAFLLIALVLVSLPLAVSAEGNDVFLLDDADLLTSAEASRLEARLEEISVAYGAQVAIVTVDQICSRDIDRFIEDLYDEGDFGYGTDNAGVLFVICMELREFRILSNGFAADAITMDDINDIAGTISSDLSCSNYVDAFQAFADKCEYYLNGYLNGFPFDLEGSLIVAVVVGLIVALIVVFVMKGQLNSVRAQDQAAAYVRPGSMKITHSGDYFLYRTVRRTPRSNSSSSGSRSGSSRNVGGGRF